MAILVALIGFGLAGFFARRARENAFYANCWEEQAGDWRGKCQQAMYWCDQWRNLVEGQRALIDTLHPELRTTPEELERMKAEAAKGVN